MATGGSKFKMSDQHFDYICTSCAEQKLTKEAIKYCIVCQQYCCHDCSLPAFPTEQCSIHKGKILDVYCGNHNVVVCYLCVAMDHKYCKDLQSVADDIDKLYKKSDTDQTKSDLTDVLDMTEERRKRTLTVLQQLQDYKTSATQAVKDYRSEIDRYLDDLEDESIKDIEREYRKMESDLLEERKMYDTLIEELKKLEDELSQPDVNKAQRFVCTKLARRKILTTKESEKPHTLNVEMTFTPVEKLRKLVEGLTSLGKSTVNVRTTKCDLYKTKLIKTIDIKLKNEIGSCLVYGSCIVNDTVLFADYMNNKLKRVDMTSLSVVESCMVPDPVGVCRVGPHEVAVACNNMVHFVSIRYKMTLSRLLKIKHKCYGIAYNNDKLYISDESKSLYMYDMAGNLLKTVTNDKHGRPLFQCSKHIVFSDNGDRIFVGDDKVGLVCFDEHCEHVKTIQDIDARADGVCVDGHDNIIVANFSSSMIAQFSQLGEKRGVIVGDNVCLGRPHSVCVHHTLNRMVVTYGKNKVQVYQLS